MAFGFFCQRCLLRLLGHCLTAIALVRCEPFSFVMADDSFKRMHYILLDVLIPCPARFANSTTPSLCVDKLQSF